jgi:hypothetical protein
VNEDRKKNFDGLERAVGGWSCPGCGFKNIDNKFFCKE